jgi:hypothetical protein
MCTSSRRCGRQLMNEPCIIIVTMLSFLSLAGGQRVVPVTSGWFFFLHVGHWRTEPSPFFRRIVACRIRLFLASENKTFCFIVAN